MHINVVKSTLADAKGSMKNVGQLIAVSKVQMALEKGRPTLEIRQALRDLYSEFQWPWSAYMLRMTQG